MDSVTMWDYPVPMNTQQYIQHFSKIGPWGCLDPQNQATVKECPECHLPWFVYPPPPVVFRKQQRVPSSLVGTTVSDVMWPDDNKQTTYSSGLLKTISSPHHICRTGLTIVSTCAHHRCHLPMFPSSSGKELQLLSQAHCCSKKRPHFQTPLQPYN